MQPASDFAMRGPSARPERQVARLYLSPRFLSNGPFMRVRLIWQVVLLPRHDDIHRVSGYHRARIRPGDKSRCPFGVRVRAPQPCGSRAERRLTDALSSGLLPRGPRHRGRRRPRYDKRGFHESLPYRQTYGAGPPGNAYDIDCRGLHGLPRPRGPPRISRSGRSGWPPGSGGTAGAARGAGTARSSGCRRPSWPPGPGRIHWPRGTSRACRPRRR